MRDTDGNPNGVDLHPNPGAKRMNGIVLLLAGCVGGLLLVIMLYSITSTSPDKAEAPAPEQTAPADTKPLTDQPDKSGLALAPPKETVPGPPVEPPPPVRTLTPEQQAYLQEQAQIRRMRIQQEIQALQAPLTVSVAEGRHAPAVSVSGENGASGGGMPSGRESAGLSSPTPQHYDAGERKDKEDFLANRSVQKDAWRLGSTRQPGQTCEIKTGTVIPGIMLSGVNSDLPGRIIGQVSQNVYDTATGRMLVIPQGSRLFGMYDSRVAVGQNRVLIAWNRILFPDGSSVDLGSMPGTDQGGYSGMEDRVDNHYLRIFGSAAIMSLITGGMAYTVDTLGNKSGNSDNPSLRDEMGTALASQMGQASLQLLQQNVTIKPTLEIRPGYRFNLVLIKDVAFDRPYTPLR